MRTGFISVRIFFYLPFPQNPISQYWDKTKVGLQDGIYFTLIISGVCLIYQQ